MTRNLPLKDSYIAMHVNLITFNWLDTQMLKQFNSIG